MRAAQRNVQQRSPSPPSQQRSPSPSQLQPSSPSQRPSSGRSALAEPVGPLAVASAAALDPHAKRLFSEPASRPAPRVLSDAEHRAELARIHGAEGSLARELADGDGREIEVMRAAGVAAGALRQLGAFRPFPDEALMRIVRMGSAGVVTPPSITKGRWPTGSSCCSLAACCSRLGGTSTAGARSTQRPYLDWRRLQPSPTVTRAARGSRRPPPFAAASLCTLGEILCVPPSSSWRHRRRRIPSTRPPNSRYTRPFFPPRGAFVPSLSLYRPVCSADT